MIYPDLIDTIEPEDLPENLQALAEVIGFENVREMIRTFHGCTFTVPSPRRLTRTVRRFVHSLARIDRSGSNIRELAAHLGISRQRVHDLAHSTVLECPIPEANQ